MTSRQSNMLVLAILLLVTPCSYSQQPVHTHSRNFQLLYANRKSDVQFLDSANTLLKSLYSKGIFFPKDTLIQILKPYKELAWSGNATFLPYRTYYFDHLANNAKMRNKLGEAIYFFEKVEQERKLSGNADGKDVLMQKCYLYTQNMLLDKAVQEYEKERHYFEGLPDKIRNGKVDRQQISNALYTLSPIASAYSYAKDSAKCASVIHLSQSILSAINAKSGLSAHDLPLFKFILLGMKFYHYRNLSNETKETHNNLEKTGNLIKSLGPESQHLKPFFEFNLATWYLDYFTEHKNADSASYYLNQLIKMPPVMPEEDFNIMVDSYRLKIWSIRKGDSKTTALIDHLLQSKDTLAKRKNEELSDLLYAFTDAEFNRDELEKSRIDKQRRTIWALAAVFATTLTGILFYSISQRSKRKLKQTLSTLNSTTNLTIAAMKESHQQSLKAEREQFAQDLHDGFSASVAAASHQVQALIAETDDPALANKLETLGIRLQNIYQHSRAKSHSWYRDSLVRQQASFTETIRFITDSALPDSQYNKDIQLEPEAVSLLNFEQRIVLIRTTQEALTNVLKHARASEVTIFLFRADDHIIFQLSDNGVGLSLSEDKLRRFQHKTSGLGWASMKSGIEEVGGTFSIASEDGFTLTIGFPVRNTEGKTA